MQHAAFGNGTAHGRNFVDRRGRVREAARWCDFVSMHGYPGYADWSCGPTDEHLVPFLAEITGWLAGGAPVLFEEFGHGRTIIRCRKRKRKRPSW